ncbi:hypothetical protein ZOSMA_27G00320 [Zostera marina]|uniref:DYW domain-containing protein n=1 Tax=Zostera marina TaxID=29655 RepID=A0A0K9PDC6_ZOSMR|nr:hypothetical protein ZOSMA_27G00320 [Zostera marina]
MYSKCNEIGDARKVYDVTPGKNAVVWTSMIAGCVQNDASREGILYFKRLLGLKSGVDLVDAVMASAALTACARVEEKHVTNSVHGLFVKIGVESDVNVRNTLMDAYAKTGNFGFSRMVFDEMKKKDVVSWNTIMAVYGQNGFSKEALDVYREMSCIDSLRRGVVTFSTVMLACAHSGALQFGKCVHNHAIRSGLEVNLHVDTAAVDMYCKCGRVDTAKKVFHHMKNKNVKSWTAMIAGCGMHGRGREALQVFHEMRRSGPSPNYVTFVAVLAACSHAGLVEEGRHWFEAMREEEEFNIPPGVEHYGCMVDLLGRSGHISEAYNLVKQMTTSPDSVIWSALLSACRVHKNVELGEVFAKKLFELEPRNVGVYVTLSNIYAEAGKWRNSERTRAIIRTKKLEKTPGYSMVELKGRIQVFMIEDRRHPQHEEIYTYLESLTKKMMMAGYIPDTSSVPHDIDEEEKERTLRVHSEKLAVVFAIINMALRTSIQVIKNLRICGDCHTFMKFISKIENREIVIRDSHRFHHFIDGFCSCGDYW